MQMFCESLQSIARFLGIEYKAGTIATGKIANLILLDKNPLANIRHTRSIDRVILKGRVINPKIQIKTHVEIQ
jgi:imidazolonepropionase-like amidohydrolase